MWVHLCVHYIKCHYWDSSLDIYTHITLGTQSSLELTIASPSYIYIIHWKPRYFLVSVRWCPHAKFLYHKVILLLIFETSWKDSETKKFNFQYHMKIGCNQTAISSVILKLFSMCFIKCPLHLKKKLTTFPVLVDTLYIYVY